MVILSLKEEKRLLVLNEVERGKLKSSGAAGLLGISVRHVRRLLAAYRKEGAAGLAHGNRGRKPHNALDECMKEKVAGLARSKYGGCNVQHFTELLEEREDISLSRSTVRRILLQSGLSGPRMRRAESFRGW